MEVDMRRGEEHESREWDCGFYVAIYRYQAPRPSSWSRVSVVPHKRCDVASLRGLGHQDPVILADYRSAVGSW